MHLVCLGVMKKILLLWITGPFPFQLGRVAVDRILQKMCAFKKLLQENATENREVSQKSNFGKVSFGNSCCILGQLH